MSDAPTSLREEAPSEEGAFFDRSHAPTRDEVTLAAVCSRCHVIGRRATPTYWGEVLCEACGEEAVADGWPARWWDAPPAPYLLALGAEGIYSLDGDGEPGPAYRWPANLEDLGSMCEFLSVSQVWIHESALPRLGLPADAEIGASFPFFELGEWKTSGRGGARGYVKIWRQGGAGLTVHFPSYEDGSPWLGTEDAFALLCHVAHYEAATKRSAPWYGGGSITSDRWLRAKYRSPRRADIIETEHPPPLLDGPGRESRYFWTRYPAASERTFRYCHALDLNLAYAAVASSLPLPVGACDHQDLPDFDKRVPGLWLIEPQEASLDPLALRGKTGLLPAPWEDQHRLGRTGPYWVTSPTMERVAQAGGFAIESYTWREHHHYLRPWYELIRDARTELLPPMGVGGPALEAVKGISRRGVGRLANRDRAASTEDLFQPYWESAVKAECRARLHRRLCALDVAPVAIDTDAVYFLSSRSSPEALAVRLGLPLGSGLGEFKAAGSCSGGEAREILATRHGGTAIYQLRKAVK